MASAAPRARTRIAEGVLAAGAEGIHVRELARRLGLAAPTVANHLRRLEAAGAVRSRLVGRSRIYTPEPPRRITRAFPVIPGEWDRRPYFLWSEDRSWRELRDDLQSVDDARRRRALELVLNGARWDDIWKLVSIRQVARELPQLHLRHAAIWSEFIRVATGT